jgi:tetratricopeptide (TPR) repeat protein
MKKIRYLPAHLILLIPALLIISFAQDEESEKDTTIVEEGPAQFIKKGDEAFKALDNQKALDFYSEAVKLEPVSYEGLWKLSRAYVDIGDTYTDKKKRYEYFTKGYELSKKAVKINPQGSKGYLYRGIAIGRIALDTTAKERIRLSKEVKSNFDKALELNPRDDYAWHGLARWHRKIATLSWMEKTFANMFLGGIPKEASVENAVTCLKKAIEINPGHINHHLELGISYEKLKKKELAVAEYKKALELPKKDSDDSRYKKDAKERLSKLK